MGYVDTALDGLARMFRFLAFPEAPSPLAERLVKNHNVQPQSEYKPGYDLSEIFTLDLGHAGLSLDIRILKPSSPSSNPNIGARNLEVHVAMAKNGVPEPRQIVLEIDGYKNALWHDEAAMKKDIADALNKNSDRINSLRTSAERGAKETIRSVPRIPQNRGLG